jgi:hypothetical protein
MGLNLPPIFKRIESLINKRGIAKKFPNFSEILEVYKDCNSAYDMSLTADQMTDYGKAPNQTFYRLK